MKSTLLSLSILCQLFWMDPLSKLSLQLRTCDPGLGGVYLTEEGKQIEVFKDGKFYCLISPGKNEKNCRNKNIFETHAADFPQQLWGLEEGMYSFYYFSKFGLKECKELYIDGEKDYDLELCRDYLDPLAQPERAFIDRLEVGEGYSIYASKTENRVYSEDFIEIWNEGDGLKLYYQFHNSFLSKYLDPEEVMAIREFEQELINYKGLGFCLQPKSYLLEYNCEQLYVSDRTCGYDPLLDLKNSLKW